MTERSKAFQSPDGVKCTERINEWYGDDSEEVENEGQMKIKELKKLKAKLQVKRKIILELENKKKLELLKKENEQIILQKKLKLKNKKKKKRAIELSRFKLQETLNTKVTESKQVVCLEVNNNGCITHSKEIKKWRKLTLYTGQLFMFCSNRFNLMLGRFISSRRIQQHHS
ncbi:hypothetical protein ACTA71_010166 [Dictyostelium dimigraforme]